MICTLQDVMPLTKHAIYFWLVNKNMFTNCKPLFDIKETWQKFYNDWLIILYSITESIFKEKWTEFEVKYETDYWVAIDYCQNYLMAK